MIINNEIHTNETTKTPWAVGPYVLTFGSLNFVYCLKH